ncbi:hypothetical protein CRG98_011367 [Punica granatum]|uniref:Uncharacterized protein n=1 Tax=Punica granatum TaxID=22663 RepID=A0A2I0KIC5_PUNGR|nr:hypothetical protein CRG98_011367 [Punica granatum]
MDKTRESVRLEAEENFPDSCDPRKLSATSIKGGQTLESTHFEGKETALTPDKPRGLTGLSLETRPEGLIREEERVMDPRRPKRLTALLREVRPRGSRASSSPCQSPPLGSDPPDVIHACHYDVWT